jgi:hypothetical protein
VISTVLDQSDKLGGKPVSSSSNCPLRNFINLFGMVNLGFAENPYTWSNNRQGLQLIKERLDRGLASPNWIHLHLKYSLLHLSTLAFDHNHISLTTNNSSCFLPRPFKFEEFWSKDFSCASIIEAAWQKIVCTHPARRLSKKLKNTKIALLEWNSNHFGNIQKYIKTTLLNLDLVQQAPPSSMTHEIEISLKLELRILLSKEEILWRSKSREIWLTCKDLNTKYFHTSTLIRRRANAINFLRLDSGIWVSSRADIGGSFTSHFTNLFTSSNTPIDIEMLDLFDPIISEEENTFLCSMPSEEEIVEALSSLGSTKAPGLDGFTTLFYKKYWSIIKSDVMLSIRNFFTENSLPRDQNHTFIALILKLSGSQSTHQYRPISLCNIFYKIISKILATRLKFYLSKIISPYSLPLF